MMDRRIFVAALAAACVVPLMAAANSGVLTATEAHQALQAGRLLLVDIRTPQEWQQTGVAEGAWPMDMRAKQFGADMMALIERNPTRQVAVICRSGNRSGYLIGLLKENGIQGVVDVSEGMAGGGNGRGWIPSGLPIVSARQALAGLPKDLRMR